MDYEPISVALKFGFLAVLYLFLLWVAASARKDLKRNKGASFDGDATIGAPSAGSYDAWLIVARGGGLDAGTRFDVFGGVTLGRSSEADISFTDRYASGLHARLYPRGDRYFLEDMNSTNGTLLDGGAVTSEAEVRDGSMIEIGDTAFRFELDRP
ncbi:MAG: FHA domain-containing protein [Solirubrobacterales bacterium]|nr:FHA domain-containing protein [Solirubrobacterales bacterium]MCB8914274.1 FHA domain-containing protein [Thermoleophilales bacterium]